MIRALAWAVTAALVTTTAVIAATGASGSLGASHSRLGAAATSGEWRGTVSLHRDSTIRNANETYHHTDTIRWRLDRPAPPDSEERGTAAGPAAISYVVADTGEPQNCGELVRRTGSVEGTWGDMVLYLDANAGQPKASERRATFEFLEWRHGPNLDFSITTEWLCAPPEVQTQPAELPPHHFGVRTEGWIGGFLIDRRRIQGRATITCDGVGYGADPPRSEAECEHDPQLGQRTVWTIMVTLDNSGCIVPGVIGKKLARARRLIRAGQCSVGRVRRWNCHDNSCSPRSTKANAGRVIAQLPHPGTAWGHGRRVRLWVG